METLHKLAGVTEASNANEQAPQPIPEPPPIPQDSEYDANHDQSVSRRASRVSLPLNRRPSHKSFRSSRQEQILHGEADAPPVPTNPLTSRPSSAQDRTSQDSARSGASGSDGDGDGEDDEYAWGPSHPCFPHPNPHCAPASAESKTTRVIRVRRDWLQAGDLYPQYANLYPEILDPFVSDDDFRFLVSNINARVKTAFDPYSTRAWIDAMMGFVTGFVWDDLGLTGSKRGVKGLEAFVEQWNREQGKQGRGVVLIQPRRTGFMTLDFVIPDPGIDGVLIPEAGDGGIGPAE